MHFMYASALFQVTVVAFSYRLPLKAWPEAPKEVVQFSVHKNC